MLIFEYRVGSKKRTLIDDYYDYYDEYGDDYYDDYYDEGVKL